jgi:hypothetical protein
MMLLAWLCLLLPALLAVLLLVLALLERAEARRDLIPRWERKR